MMQSLIIFSTVLILALLTQIPIPDAKISNYYQPAGAQVEEVRQPEVPVFPDVKILARSAIVEKFPSGQILFEKDSGKPMALASISKLMTAFVVKEVIPDPAITFAVRILSEDVLTEGDSGFMAGEEFLASDLFSAMLVGSSNDAAHALARTSTNYIPEAANRTNFTGLMNEKAHELGLNSMFFFNETGLDVSDVRPGGTGSAEEVARIFSLLLKNFPEILAATSYPEVKIKSLSGRAFSVKNSNILAGRIPGLIASKTGFTDIAGGNLVVAADLGFQNPVVIAVLGSTEQGRFDDVLKLYEAAKNYYRQ